jgi:Mrp family chromosome partitioning ATPase
LSVTDPVVSARVADAVVLVARSDKTRRQSLTRARDLLNKAQVHIAGVVVNDLALDSVDYRQYYGYYGKSYAGYYQNGNENGSGDGAHTV